MALDDETREAIVAAVAAELDRRLAAGEHPTADQVADMVEDEAEAQGVTVDEDQADDMADDARDLVAEDGDDEDYQGPPEVADVGPDGAAPAPEPHHEPPPEPAPVREVEATADDIEDDASDAAHDVAPGEPDGDDAPSRVHPFWSFNLFDLFRG